MLGAAGLRGGRLLLRAGGAATVAVERSSHQPGHRRRRPLVARLVAMAVAVTQVARVAAHGGRGLVLVPLVLGQLVLLLQPAALRARRPLLGALGAHLRAARRSRPPRWSQPTDGAAAANAAAANAAAAKAAAAKAAAANAALPRAARAARTVSRGAMPRGAEASALGE